MCMRMRIFLEASMKKPFSYFSRTESFLGISSVLVIILIFLVFDRENYLTLLASIIGVTSLLFCAKGNPIGQVLMVFFSLFYGFISYTFSYYGEMITYLFMTLPMCIISLISWLKNPYKGNRAEVKVNSISKTEIIFMLGLTIIVTIAFYYILKLFGTANLLPSTISVGTSFIAAYLTFRRCSTFALAYAVNDIVLIVLWTMATLTDIHYISVLVCFVAFLFNDIYCFINWKQMKKRQQNESC